ncbi:Pyrroline-5-carboxylate reductase [Candidatus Bilamarchaeum dharawalense]|uniref:Pyrroline-5-carboxylate reductase n=1 Tax=Candidatus Bilamarchaeum dharawalense TaxID=2885759 RepID=A0A5E4LX79_9ARCH|nr:Pyrroline-5-carboxylate reductase [Candidatus Bilamarchaeum dharawalense]
MRIAIIGVGRLGTIIAKALSEHNEVILVDKHPEDLVTLAGDVGAKATDDMTVTKFVDIAVISVKPTQVEEVIKKIPEANLIVSCAAGIPIKKLESWGAKNIIRIMPNICAEVDQAVIAYAMHTETERKEKVFLTAFTALGMCLKVDEQHLDPITATSGSGPAFMAYFAQAMIEEAVANGLTEEDAELVVAQTLIGTGTLMKSGWTTKKIIETVASPGGTTEAGLKMLDEKGTNKAIHTAVKFATEKAKELGK